MKELIAASKDSEVLENDAMRHIRELENEAEQLQKLIAEAKLAANRASGRWGEEAKNGG
ncbi:hypothetical protein QMO14_30195 [Variovorax sp. CAN2819]|nr:hypothetical protein [Variovorax sp. CAN15]